MNIILLRRRYLIIIISLSSHFLNHQIVLISFIINGVLFGYSYNNLNPIIYFLFSSAFPNIIKNYIFFPMRKTHYNMWFPLTFSHPLAFSYRVTFCIPTTHSMWLEGWDANLSNHFKFFFY